MDATDRFEAEFLSELMALDAFLGRRGAGGGAALPVGREDPDVRRLLEAVAFFAARTRLLARDAILRTVARLARGHLDPLLAPLPAAGMLQASPTPRLTEAAVLPRGVEVRLTAPDGTEGAFSTERSLIVRPLRLDATELLRRRGGGWLLRIHLEATAPVRGSIGALSFHVSRMGELAASLRLLHMLREHAEGAAVRYEGEARAAPEDECGLSFGAPRSDAPAADDDFMSPLERIRQRFHHPEEDLFFHVHAPPREGPWRRATVAVRLGPRWPAGAGVEGPELAGALHLFVVPIRNLRRDSASPILCDGTRDAYPLAHPDTAAGFRVRAVRGAFRVGDRGLAPLRAGLLADGEGAWEVEEVGDDPEARQHRLLVRAPGAFARPFRISVDASWYQPGFDARAPGRLAVALPARSLEGVSLRVLGDVRPHRQSPLRADGLQLLDVLALKGRAALDREEIVRLLSAAGAGDHPDFGPLLEAIAALETREIAAPSRGAVPTRMYTLAFARGAPDEPGLVAAFAAQVLALLDAWSAGPVGLEIAARGGPVAAVAPPGARPAARGLLA